MKLILILFFIGGGFSQGNVINLKEPIFTENGRPVAYPSEEDVLSQFLQENENSDSIQQLDNLNFNEPQAQESSFNPPEEKQGEKQASVQKREGQEEFITFVDHEPINSRRLADKQSELALEKRARVDNVKNSAGGDFGVGSTMFIAVATVCTAAAIFGVIAAVVVVRRVQRRNKLAQDSEYPHYGITGPSKERSGSTSPVAAMDVKLASSAQLYHYQHTKQQIIAMEQSQCESKGQDSEDSEDEGEEGDFSVYEYPGLAPTGDIEVSNPLFQNISSPLTKTDPNQQPEQMHEKNNE